MKIGRARLFVVLSMAIWGTLAPFVRQIGVSSGELALFRGVMAAVLIGGWLLLSGKQLFPRGLGHELPLLLASGAAMGINWILLFEAYRYTTVSAATLSYYFAPVLVTLACPILFRERPEWRQIVCFVMSTLGLVLVIGVGGTGGEQGWLGILFGLGAAFFYASVVLMNKKIKGVGGIHRTFLQFIAAIVVLLPYVCLTGGIHLGVLNGRGWICLLVVGLVHSGLAYCLYFSALSALPGQEAAILSYIDPLVAVVLSVTVLGEPITLGQIIGGALILGFTLFNELSPGK